MAILKNRTKGDDFNYILNILDLYIGSSSSKQGSTCRKAPKVIWYIVLFVV